MSTNELDIAMSIDAIWLLLNGFLVLLMQAGFAMLELGGIRPKFIGVTILKNVGTMSIACFMYAICGFGLSFGNGSPIIGLQYFFLQGLPTSLLPFFFFNMAVALASVSIALGSCQERVFCLPFFVYTVLMLTFVSPPIVHWFWSSEGFMSPRNPSHILSVGFMDFAGSGVIHVASGVMALCSTIVCGPRDDFMNDEGTVFSSSVTSYLNAGIGTLLVFVGTHGFNCGSTSAIANAVSLDQACRIAVNTSLASAASAVTSIIYTNIKSKSTDISHCLGSIMAGLVAIAASCHAVDPWAALIIGSGACLSYEAINMVLKAWRIDDPIQVIPVHLGAGAWGVVAAGLFPRLYGAGLFFGNGAQLAVQLLGLVVIVTWCALLTMLIFTVIDRFIGLNEVKRDGEEGAMAFGTLDLHQRESIKNEMALMTSSGVRTIISNPRYFRMLVRFTQFCEKEFCSESIAFLKAAHALEMQIEAIEPDQVETRKLYMTRGKAALYEKFIKPGSPSEININSDSRERFKAGLSNESWGTVGAAVDEICSIMQNGPFNRFWQSDHRHSVIKAREPVARKKPAEMYGPSKIAPIQEAGSSVSSVVSKSESQSSHASVNMLSDDLVDKHK